MSLSVIPDDQTAARIKITRNMAPKNGPRWFMTRAMGIAASVPAVPGTFGNRPVPNQDDKIRAFLLIKSALSNDSFRVKLSDRGSDIKQALAVYIS